MTPEQVDTIVKTVGIEAGETPSAKYPPLFSGYYCMTAGQLMNIVNMVEAHALARVVLESPMASREVM